MTPRNARDASLDLLARLQDQEPRHPVASGIEALDDVLDGGFRQGLHILGGQPGAGKTSLTVQVLLRMVPTMPAIYFSAEPPVDELLARLLAGEIGRSPRILLDAEPNAIADAYVAIEHLPLDSVYVLRDERPASGSVAALGEAVKAVAHEHGRAPFVAVDYLQKLDPGRAGARDDVRVSVARCSAALATLVRDHDLTGLVVSSLNRASYRNEPSLDCFKESGEIEFDADVAMLLRSPKADDDADSGPSGSARRELWILKHRFGLLPGKGLPLLFDGRLGSFRSVDPA